jgi:cyclopropane fatty-acyl-phospholipid synthase-like methyltransferase
MQRTEADKSELLMRTRRLFAAERRVWAWRYWLRLQICPFEKLLVHVPDGSRLLDIGCGGGLFLGLLAMRDPTLQGTGVDSSSDAIACANRMAQQLGSEKISFLSAPNIDAWPKGQYDMVSMIDVLHHVAPEERRKFFLEAAKHVPKGGRLLCKDMRTRPRWKAAANILQDLIVAKQWVHHPSPRSVEGWGSEARLRLVSYEEWDRMWSAHAFWVFQRD